MLQILSYNEDENGAPLTPDLIILRTPTYNQYYALVMELELICLVCSPTLGDWYTKVRVIESGN